MRSFDPVRLGHCESKVWVAYYRRRWGSFLGAAVGMIRAGFGLPWPATLRCTLLLLRAVRAWAPDTGNDPDTAHARMRQLYLVVARTRHGPFDPDTAARLELEWWRVHRDAGPGPDGTDPLADALAALYAHLSGVPAETVRPAAVHRAQAMRISDAWVASGCDPASPALAAERRELIRGYAVLRGCARNM